MRLLNVHTLKLSEFFEREIPEYVILSHRWGKDEPTYKQYRKDQDLCGSGYQKILDFCSFVRRHRVPAYFMPHSFVEWLWIDTICIDKRSSAELSEAINSMFQWYKNAVECIVLLADLPDPPYDGADGDDEAFENRISRCEWFERGWTLQELLAPSRCIFVDAYWKVIGHVAVPGIPFPYGRGPDISEIVSRITNIPVDHLKVNPFARLGEKRFAKVSIAQRMSWASNRLTTRCEDEAYCLLGLFEINMPLIYGEGSRAFIRLQEEILKRSTDQSILAWIPDTHFRGYGILARSPRDFQHAQTIVKMDKNHYKPVFSLTNRGLYIETHALHISGAIFKKAVFEEKGQEGLILTSIQHSTLLRDVKKDGNVILLPLDCYDYLATTEIHIEAKKAWPWMLFVWQYEGEYVRWILSQSVKERMFMMNANRELSRTADAMVTGAKVQLTIEGSI